MNREKTLAKNTIIIFIGRVFTQLVSFFLIPIYTSLFSKQEYGTVDLVVSYIGLFSPIITVQLEMGVFRFLVDERECREESSKTISTTLITSAFTIAISTVVAIVVIFFSHLQIDYKYLIYFSIVITSLNNIALQIARGIGETLIFTVSSVICGIVNVLFNLILIVILNVGVKSIYISIIAANSIALLLLTVKIPLKKYLSFSKFDIHKFKELLNYSLPLIPNSISWWVISVSDRTFISYYLGVAANGIYAISNKFSALLITLFGIFNLSWTETVAIHINDDDRNIFFSKMFKKIIGIFVYLSALMLLMLCLLYKLLIDNEFLESYNYIPLLLIGEVFNIVVSMFSSIYIGLKLSRQVAITSFIAAMINIIVNFALINKIQIYAAALSTIMAFLTMTLYRVFDLRNYLKIRIEISWIIKNLLTFMFATILYFVKNNLISVIGVLIIMIMIWLENRKAIIRLSQFVISKIKNNLIVGS